MGFLDPLPRDLRRRRVCHPRAAAPRLRSWLRRTGPRPVAALGLIGLLVWAMVGSAMIGLRGPETSDAEVAGLWFAGVAVIAVAAAAAALIAAGDERNRGEGDRG